MKPLIFLLFNLLPYTIAPINAEVICDPQATAVIDERTLNASKKILEAVNLTLKEKQKAIEKMNHESSRLFHQTLPKDMKDRMDQLFTKIYKSNDSLISLVEADGDPVLLVNGIDNREIQNEWIKPFHKLLDRKLLSYYFKWDKSLSLDTNKDELLVKIRSLLEKHSGKKLTIIGYSAGGVLTTLAMDQLADDPIAKQIHFHTVAAPLFGYGAPAWAKVGSLLFGKSNIEIGIGNYQKLTHKNLNKCTHWVTTNCEMDQHSCDREDINPQLGPKKNQSSELPCGATNTQKFHDEGHASVLSRAFNEIIN